MYLRMQKKYNVWVFRPTIYLFLFLSLCTNPLQASEYSLEKYSFINTDINELNFPLGDKKFQQFYKKLDTLIFENKGQIRIAHFGGSHIQADVFSNRVREKLATQYPGQASSRGFVFPYSAARTNTPSSYASYYKGKWDMSRNVLREISKPLGLLGIAVSTTDPQAEITLLLNKYNPVPIWLFNRVRLFGFSSLNDVEPQILLDSIFYKGVLDTSSASYVFELPRLTDSLILSFRWNDSLLQDSLLNLLKIDSLNLNSLKKEEVLALDSMFYDSLAVEDTLKALQHQFTMTGLLVENDFPGISYTNIGINGAKVESYLACPKLEHELKFFKPDLVIFSIGINDANVERFNEKKFLSDYDSLIQIIQKVNPGVAIIFTTNNDSFRKKNRWRYIKHPNGEIAKQNFYKLAQKHKAAVWDLFSIMGGLGSMAEWEKAKLAKKDKVHFNSTGYKIIGDLFYEALLKAYSHHLSHLPAESPSSKIKPQKAYP